MRTGRSAGRISRIRFLPGHPTLTIIITIMIHDCDHRHDSKGMIVVITDRVLDAQIFLATEVRLG